MRSDLKQIERTGALDDARIVPACSTFCDPGDERRCRSSLMNPAAQSAAAAPD